MHEATIVACIDLLHQRSRVDRYVVNPNVIKQLATGEAVVLSVVGVRRVARITVPTPPAEA